MDSARTTADSLIGFFTAENKHKVKLLEDMLALLALSLARIRKKQDTLNNRITQDLGS